LGAIALFPQEFLSKTWVATSVGSYSFQNNILFFLKKNNILFFYQQFS